MAYGYLELGKGTRPDVVPSDRRQNEGKRGPAEIVGGAVGGVVDAVGRRVHTLLLGHL